MLELPCDVELSDLALLLWLLVFAFDFSAVDDDAELVELAELLESDGAIISPKELLESSNAMQAMSANDATTIIAILVVLRRLALWVCAGGWSLAGGRGWLLSGCS